MMIDLLIETLTGAAFELRVSPFETIISVKAKIQREEGIPIGQQHLIWQNHELLDDACLRDYTIPSGATLKLVLGMRGGPINTRRVSLVTRPTSGSCGGGRGAGGSARSGSSVTPPVPRGSGEVEGRGQTPPQAQQQSATRQQVTLLVFKEGDQFNFFRIVDRGDGTLTPLAESLSAGSRPGFSAGEEDSDSDSIPGRATGQGGCRLDNVGTGSSTLDHHHPPTTAASSSTVGETASGGVGGGGEKSGNIREKLRVLQWKMDQLKLTRGRKSDGLRGGKLAPISSSVPPESELRRYGVLGPTTTTIPGTNNSTATAPPSSTSTRLLQEPSASDQPQRQHQPAQAMASRLLNLKASQTSNKSSSSSLLPSASSLHYMTQALRHHNYPSRLLSQQLNDLLPAPGNDLSSSHHRLLPSRTTSYPQAPLHPPSSSASFVGAGVPLILPPVLIQRSSLACGGSPPPLLPPATTMVPVPPKNPLVQQQVKMRCAECKKRTGLASSYPCRCGHNFCSRHRYAEAHECPFDYKAEGRRYLQETNPVVTASKLPKI